MGSARPPLSPVDLLQGEHRADREPPQHCRQTGDRARIHHRPPQAKSLTLRSVRMAGNKKASRGTNRQSGRGRKAIAKSAAVKERVESKAGGAAKPRSE